MPTANLSTVAEATPPEDAWQAAEAAGVDMDLLRHSLSLSVWERVLEHERALKLVEALEKVRIRAEP